MSRKRAKLDSPLKQLRYDILQEVVQHVRPHNNAEIPWSDDMCRFWGHVVDESAPDSLFIGPIPKECIVSFDSTFISPLFAALLFRKVTLFLQLFDRFNRVEAPERWKVFITHGDGELDYLSEDLEDLVLVKLYILSRQKFSMSKLFDTRARTISADNLATWYAGLGAMIPPTPYFIEHADPGAVFRQVDRPTRVFLLSDIIASHKTTPKVEKWLREPFVTVLPDVLHRLINPIMQIEYSAYSTNRSAEFRRKFLTRVMSDRAFMVKSSELHFRVFEKTSLVNLVEVSFDMTASFKNVQCIVEESLFNQHRQDDWIFIRSGTYAGPDSHPLLKDATRKYHGRVPKLNILSRFSDGLLIPVPLFNFDNGVGGFLGLQGVRELSDVTSHLVLYCRTCRRGRKYVSVVRKTILSTLTDYHLSLFAPHYIHFSREQKFAFSCLFFDVFHLDLSCLLTSPSLVRFCEACLVKVIKSNSQLVPMSPGYGQLPEYGRGSIVSPGLWQSLPIEKFSVSIRTDLTVLKLLSSATSAYLNMLIAAYKSQGLVLFLHIYQKLVQLNIPLTTTVIPNHLIPVATKLLTGPFPPLLKRVVLSSLTELPGSLSYVSDDDRTSLIPHPLPNCRVHLTALDLTDRMIVFRFTRDGRLINPGNMLSIASNSPYQPAIMYDVAFTDEPARGPSVQVEILQLLWASALQRKIMVQLETDELILSSDDFSREDATFCTVLGFVSGLCIRLGHFLPYPLHSGMWSLLTHAPDYPIVLSEVYKSRFDELVLMTESMSLTELRDHYQHTDLTSTRSDILIDHTLPDYANSAMFLGGFSSQCSKRIITLFRSGEHNAVFCDPKWTLVTLTDFLNSFDTTDDANKQVQSRFKHYLSTLTPEELTRWIYILTGKRRLPLLDRNESSIKCYVDTQWDAYFPQFANCSHSIRFPASYVSMPEKQFVERLTQILTCENHYGMP